MPEISEVRIMSDLINRVASSVDHFVGITKSSEHKSKTDLTLPYSKFQIIAEPRGKELRLQFFDWGHRGMVYRTQYLTFTMGMSGNWNYSKNVFSIPKHTHLMIADCNGGVLGMQDVRRFARWDWRSWNPERSMDPTDDPVGFENFIELAINYENDHRIFNKPIYEALMDQRYFNGIGNYLRAEILGRIDEDPNQSARSYIRSTGSQFFDTLQTVIKESYLLGGGQFKDWYNQADLEKKKSKEFQAWMQFYFNKERCVPIKDSSKRTFWMDKKWIP